MALINCTECKAQISDKAKKCPKCGMPIEIKETFKCFECGTELEKGTKDCSNCGAEQEVKQEVKKEIIEEFQEVETLNTRVSIPTEAQPKRKKTILVVIIIVSIALFGGLGTFIYMNQQAKQAEIGHQLQEQSTKIQEQEKIEAARKSAATQQQNAANAAQRAANLADLQNSYDNAVTTLRKAKIELDETQKFQLLRSASEKEQQIQSRLEVIRSWENEVDRLKKEIDKY